MVSTRQMSVISNNGNECIGQSTSGYVSSSRASRNSASHSSCSNSDGGPSTSSGKVVSSQSVNLLDLPQEVIEKILGYISFKNICQLRFVCRAMDRTCGHVLNSTFQRLQTQMLQRFQNIKAKMPRRESARRNHHLACESDIIETLHMRLTLLQMAFGKHIERKHCCFFPGEILDEVYNILHYIKITPKLARPYKVTDELFDLSTMAMEYFKEKIEPDLPEIAYFGTDFLDFTSTFSSTSTGKYLPLDSSPLGPEEPKESDQVPNVLGPEDLVEPMPQSNMVLRKRIRKIKQGMKRYSSQLTLLKQDLKSCKRKTAEQQNQISEQQKQLAEQQKQTLEYAARLDEYDKKNEEISRKFSTLLQELNKCKTELQYWRSKSPAALPFCTGCGTVITPPAEEIQALVNQGVMPEGLGLQPLQSSDLVPMASCSVLTLTEGEERTDEKRLNDLDLNFESPLSPISAVKGTKRKLNKTKETPSLPCASTSSSSGSSTVKNSAAPNAKRARHGPGFRGKRAKI
ncbi:F-box only protein 28 [Agrilus planipennis]|uniref:F-box only protein 28 n=1 Tax=Agrilus planipennis TaxID=224129 RepID=A0A1W4XA06_AGRPL|nr:F-box only protein 28 [Agrilus planipennis]XP_018329169.1 F-box only protein 28 [Agrilus planipennis]XP_018329170.1 F-box only protein 28 [Agrilus planipennis]